MIYNRCIILILIIFFFNYIKINTCEKFIPNATTNAFLEKCFDKNAISSFKKYYNVTDVLQTSNGIIFGTPTRHIDDLQSYSRNGIFLNNLCVDPKMRNKGFGTELVSKIINKAKAARNDHVILQVLQNNFAAIKIYEKLGFKIYFNGINEDGEKAIIYILYL